MFILTQKNSGGVHAVKDKTNTKTVQVFEQEDDASRYAMQLEDLDYPEMHVIEVEPDMMVDVCEDHGFGYTIITPNDIVIPPATKNDFI